MQTQVAEYALENESWPTSLPDLGYAEASVRDGAGTCEIALYDDGVVGVQVGADDAGVARYVVLAPAVVDGDIRWSCSGQNLDETIVAAACGDGQ